MRIIFSIRIDDRLQTASLLRGRSGGVVTLPPAASLANRSLVRPRSSMMRI